MNDGYAGYKIAANGDVTVTVNADDGYYSYDAVIPFAEFAKIAEESANAERGNTDLPQVRGMI